MTFDKNVLFVVSVGNITKRRVMRYLKQGLTYPHYLAEPFCRVANPGHSSFSLTVGSINHADFDDLNSRSMGAKGDVSAFSRSGCGIWGMIKPDVVEYGGSYVESKSNPTIVTTNPSTCTQLMRSTLNGGNAFGNDDVGTSFSTPKVSYIVSQLLKLYPDESVNLLRALVIQGARLPNDGFNSPDGTIIKRMGYVCLH